MNILIQTIDGIQEVLAICPCCGEIFRLVEGKFIFPQKRPRTCEYSELVALEERLADMEERLESAEERFKEKLRAQRDKLIETGRKLAKKKLKKIDPTFSAKDIDPQDVKVIFNPVEYLIFHGLNSEEGVNLVEFVSRSPESKAQEMVAESIDRTVLKGDVEFETLHMRDDGSFEIRKEASGA
jgi:predicted Holliday junction resolvase-like endonuclease